MRKSISFLLPLGVVALGWSIVGRSNGASEATAVRLAEEYIVAQGYTDILVDPSTKLSREMTDPASRDDILDRRRDTLEMKSAYAFEADGEWLVGFRRKHGQFKRGVVVDKRTRKCWIIHQDMF